MSTWYVWIKAMHEPHDLGVDEENRQMYGTNFIAQRQPAQVSPGDFEDEIVSLLTGVASFGTNLFVGASARVPSGPGPYLTLVADGGMAPESTQNKIAAYRNPTVQLIAHGLPATAAKAMAVAAYNALIVVKNQFV